MALNQQQRQTIQQTIKSSIQRKLQTYQPETSQMPFHYRLLGRDRMALFSFIHSLNTTFGTSIFEPVAEIMAKTRFLVAEKQHEVGRTISQKAQAEIQRIIDDLTLGKNPDKSAEVKRIRLVCRNGPISHMRAVKADLFLQDKDGVYYLFDIKTAKPNISNFKDFKRTLLEWTAILLTQQPNAKVNTFIAIPYNPYYPKPYERWTLRGMLDLDNELKVAEEFWDFLGGKGAYQDLLICFENAGLELRPELDAYFAKFR